MLTFSLQLLDFLFNGRIYLYLILFLGIIILWACRLYLSRGYQPWASQFEGTAGVIIPVVDETPQIFKNVLQRILLQDPDELIVVINGNHNRGLEDLCNELGVRYLWCSVASKRKAISEGVKELRSEIIVLVDSDTLWERNALSELLKPFTESVIGGVTAKQRIFEPNRSFLTRWANWLERVRFSYSLPAMSELGTVGCLPGRTIAFRREVLVDNMHKFLNEKFLGNRQEISDDRALTNYALRDGWKTVYQSSSLVLTDAPTGLVRLAKQQYRWARGSQYNTLKMLGWMIVRSRWLALYYVADILIPFVTLSIVIAWAIRWGTNASSNNVYDSTLRSFGSSTSAVLEVVLLAIFSSWLLMAVRFGRVIKESPKEFWWMPLYAMLNTFVLMPIRVLGFFRSAIDGGWGTRTGAYQSQNPQPLRAYLPYLFGAIILAGLVAFGLFCCS